jgi:hypothetical protein
MFSPELVHELRPPGMPPHMLHLKEGAIYILLRNMYIKLGLCNASRFLLLDCSNLFVLKCQLIPAGQQAADQEPTIFYLPCINSTPAEQYPFLLKRKQLPILPAFAMTTTGSRHGAPIGSVPGAKRRSANRASVRVCTLILSISRLLTPTGWGDSDGEPGDAIARASERPFRIEHGALYTPFVKINGPLHLKFIRERLFYSKGPLFD